MSNNGNPNSEIKVLFTIGVDKDNVVIVSGDLNNKKLCYHLLAEAIKIVADYKPAIVKPDLGHRMLNFARHFKK